MLRLEAKATLRELHELLTLKRARPDSGIQIERRKGQARVLLVDGGKIEGQVRVAKDDVETLCNTAGCSSVSVEELVAQLYADVERDIYRRRAIVRTDAYGDW